MVGSNSIRINKPGVVLRWREDNGFGFIQPSDGSQEIFFHASALGALTTPTVGQDVVFDIIRNTMKPRARTALSMCDMQ